MWLLCGVACSRRGEEGAEVVGVALVSDGEAVVTEEPGYWSFDHPTVFAELGVGLDAFAGDADGHAAVADPVPQCGVVVGRPSSPSAALRSAGRGRFWRRGMRSGAEITTTDPAWSR